LIISPLIAILLPGKRIRVNKSFLIYGSLFFFLLALTILQISSLRKENSNSPISDNPGLSYKSLSSKNNIYMSKNSSTQMNRNQSTPANPSNKNSSMIMTNLLKKRESLRSAGFKIPGRNIFNSAREINKAQELQPPQQKEEKKGVEPKNEMPSVNFKLMGIITKLEDNSPLKLKINYAIISTEGEIFIAKTGDVLLGRYEIKSVSSDKVEIKDIILDKIEILSLEKEKEPKSTSL
jgi:hypothetical protein